MKKYLVVLGAIILSLSLNSQVLAQEVVLHVDFTGSSFDAHSVELKGSAKAVGKKFTADRLTLALKTLVTGVDLRDKHLWKYLEIEKYPEAVLSNVIGEDGKFKGDLTLHGVTKKGVEGEYAVDGSKLKANFKTNISDYKIAPPVYMGGTVTVEDEVELHATLPLVPGAAVKK